MQSERRERLVAIMRQLADGDRAAVIALYLEFGRELSAAVRREATTFGVPLDAEAIDGLTMDAAFELESCASAWDPDGRALPWTWAKRRLRALVSRHIGQHADELDADRHEVPEPAPAPSGEHTELEVLVALAALRPDCALLLEGLQAIATERNQAIFLAYRVQTSLGDPSPASTVGALFRMRPDAIRQAVHRTQQRLRDLAGRDERFRGLPDTGCFG